MDNQNKDKKVKSQCLNITLGVIAAEALKAVVGFVALYFFKPVWNWLVKWYKK